MPFHGRGQLLTNPLALTCLRLDLAHTTRALALVYDLNERFIAEVWHAWLSTGTLQLCCHHGTRHEAAALVAAHPTVSASSWSSNRQLHAKVICLPDLGVTYIGSHNWTWYSWTVGHNVTVRLTGATVTRRAVELIARYYDQGQQISPQEPA